MGTFPQKYSLAQETQPTGSTITSQAQQPGASLSMQALLALAGKWNGTDPFGTAPDGGPPTGYYATVPQNNIGDTGTPDAFLWIVGQYLEGRWLIYGTASNPGCASIPGSQGAVPGAGTVAAGVGISVASSLVPIPGLGSLVSGIVSLFSAHGKEITQFEDVMCNVAFGITSGLTQIDAAVANGSVTAQNGIAAVQQMCNAALQALACCNNGAEHGAWDWYTHAIASHSQFVEVLYPYIAPQPVQAAPASVNASVPVAQGGANTTLAAVAAPSGSPAAQIATGNWAWILVAVAAFGVILLL